MSEDQFEKKSRLPGGNVLKSSSFEGAEQPNAFYCVKSAVKVKSSKGWMGIARGSCEEKLVVFEAFTVFRCIHHT